MATRFITVPIEIMHDKKLSPNQKFILSEIMQLSELDKGCFASNKHFSELIGITTMGVSKALHDLEEKGYIKIDNSQTKRNFGRTITINSGKSPINSGLESKGNKTNNKTEYIHPLLVAYMEVDVDITDKGKKEILEFIEYRNKIKKSIKTIKPIKAYIKVIRELLNDGYKLEDIKELMQQKEWQSIEAEWVRKAIKKDEEEQCY